MKILAVFMVLAGLTIGAGAALEFVYYGPEATQFWLGVFAMPAGFFFALAGVLLYFRGPDARRLVLLAGVIMATATIAATALEVMGPPATIVGMTSALASIGWALKNRALEPNT
jgi:hypothetical protein